MDAALADISWEVLFVDDDSPDGTATLIQEIGDRDPRVGCLLRVGRRGLSSACIDGMSAAESPYLAVMDGDLQHDEAILPEMLAALKAGNKEIAIGSRYMEGAGTGEWGFGRVLVSRMATLLSRFLVPKGVTDPMSGFFMIRRETFMRIVPGLSGKGFKILLDIFASAEKPLDFAEIPFIFRPRHAGESKLDGNVGWAYLQLLMEKSLGKIGNMGKTRSPRTQAGHEDAGLRIGNMGKTRSPRTWHEPVLVAASGLVLVWVLWQIWGRFLPAVNGRMGVDYSLFLPLLLNGLYWFQANGPFAVPWFTPAFCGGLPMYPDPQSIYYSLPQVLTLFVDPVRAVQATFLVFASLGFVGTFILLRRSFGTGMAVALFGASVFLFSTTFPARMVIGHLTFHSLALVPLIAYFLLRPAPAEGTRMHFGVGAVTAGLLLSYVFQSGNVNLIIPMVLAVTIIGLIHALLGGRLVKFLAGFAAAAAVAGMTSAGKLASALSFLAASPREGYPLPGAEQLTGLVETALRFLFLGPADELYRSLFVNVRWSLDRYEFEMTVTAVPAVVLSVAAIIWLAKRLRRPRAPDPRRLALGGAILLLLAVPLAVNVYTPEWNAVLKQIPIVKNSSTLIRWFIAYVPVIVVVSALVVQRLGHGVSRNGVAVLGIVLVVAINLQTDRAFYANQKYNPRTVLAAHEQAAETGRALPVSEIVVYTDRRGRLRLPIGRNDALAGGRSALLCYAPIFGYQLEWLPPGLVPGPTFAKRDGNLNLFDPACFVFPNANACQPGDRFSAERTKDASAFVSYRPYPFRFSTVQSVANALNLASLFAVIAFLVFAAKPVVSRYRKSKSRSG